jgi:hypothetical protein
MGQLHVVAGSQRDNMIRMGRTGRGGGWDRGAIQAALVGYLPAHPRGLEFEAITDGLAGWRGCAGQSGYGIPQPRTNWNASQPSVSRRNDVRRLGGA